MTDDKKPSRDEVVSRINQVRRKVAKSKPKNADGTTFYENLTGKPRESKQTINSRYHGHHRKDEK